MSNSPMMDDILRAFDGMGRAEAPAGLYGRIRNRMQEYPETIRLRTAWILAATLVCCIALNIFLLTGKQREGRVAAAEQVVSDYGLNASAY
jgi:hypothetical protein